MIFNAIKFGKQFKIIICTDNFNYFIPRTAILNFVAILSNLTKNIKSQKNRTPKKILNGKSLIRLQNQKLEQTKRWTTTIIFPTRHKHIAM